METSSCYVDGGTLIGIILIGLFIASLAGLFSKDKATRTNALIVGFGISIGGTLLALISC